MEKECPKCRQLRPLDWFIEGRQLCQQCINHQHTYRQRHKEQVNAYNKQYYQEHKEEIKAKKKDMYIDCFYCKCPVHEYRMKRHIESNKHQKLMLAFHNKNNTEIN